MGWILVTNDDGWDSPALVPLVRALSPLAEVRTVVPDRERSWISKAITRFDDVEVERADKEDCAIWRTTGCPADCAQIGIHSLFDTLPSLVVSGINVGFNHGLAFFLSSGTVGGATEGWIAGLPALAFSTGVTEHHERWAGEVLEPEARGDWERGAALCAQIAATVQERGMPGHSDLLSVNFPWGSGPETAREVTELGRVGYDQVFQRQTATTYAHKFSGFSRRSGASLAKSDLIAARQGVVSITPVQLPSTAEVPDAERGALEQAERSEDADRPREF